MSIFTYNASGKFLLFGEYLVLRGTKCLAMPLIFGQHLEAKPIAEKGIIWSCFDHNKQVWLSATFSDYFEILQASNLDLAKKIQQILFYIFDKRPGLFSNGWHLKFELDFNRDFGMGTSSTLVSLLHQWAGVDPYQLLNNIFGGSGYDIAAATAKTPFLYSMDKKILNEVALSKKVTDYLLFVYTGNKQRSEAEIKTFANLPTNFVQLDEMNDIVVHAAQCQSIEDWEYLMRQSEQLLSEILAQRPIQEKYFNDYSFKIKSLGAWGGDFIMASCRNIEAAKQYFTAKNCTTIYTYNELINS